MNLDELKLQVEKDLKVDNEHLDTESLKNQEIKAKYLDIKSKYELLLFKAKIDSISSGNNRPSLLQKEKATLRKNIDKTTSNMLQMERNLSFFANSKGANKLKEETQKKIDSMQKEVDQLKRMLKAIPNE